MFMLVVFLKNSPFSKGKKVLLYVFSESFAFKFRPFIKFPSWCGWQHSEHLLMPLLHSDVTTVSTGSPFPQLLPLVCSFQIDLLTFLTDFFFVHKDNHGLALYSFFNAVSRIGLNLLAGALYRLVKYRLIKYRLIKNKV